MKALPMKRTPAIALACALAATAAIGVGVAQASAADVEASDNVTLEERIDGDVKNDGVYAELDDQVEEPEGNLAEATEEAAEESDGVANVGITDGGIENEADDDGANLAASSETTEDEADSLASVGITDDGIENSAEAVETDAAGGTKANAAAVDDDAEEEEADAEAKLVAGTKAEKRSDKTKASASASNVIEGVENEYTEVEERAAEDLDEADAEGNSSASHYIDEDEPAENIVELRGE